MAWQMLVLYGFRPSEVYGLQVRDITDDRIEIRRSIDSWGNVTGEKNKNVLRVVALIPPAHDVIARARELQRRYRRFVPIPLSDDRRPALKRVLLT